MPADRTASPEDVLLTGTARSGTTLTCYLLNKLPDTVALFEPIKVKEFAQLGDYERIADSIAGFCADQRASLLERGVAISRQEGGAVPDNPHGTERNATGLRPRSSAKKGEVAVDKVLEPDFTLVVKHVASFTALLGALVDRFRVYAVVRNPLAALASWNSIDFNLRDGHVPAAERIDPELRATLAAIDDPLDRQVHLMGWFHGQFHRHLPDESIIRYESIVDTGGAALETITPRARQLSEPLSSKNSSELYDRDLMSAIGERLLRSDGAHWDSYTRESVERLLELSLSG